MRREIIINDPLINDPLINDPAPSFVWLDGRLLPMAQAGISPADRGFLLGDGLFETMRVQEGRVRHATLHFDRLEEGGALLRLPVPARAQMRAAMEALLEADALRSESRSGSGSLRLTLSRGIGPRGLAPPATPRPTLLLTYAPAPETSPAPVTLHVSAQTTRDETSPLCRAKTLSMLPSVLARLEAGENGADDALFLNRQGAVSEASAANFLALIEGELVTPPLSDGPLPGTARRRLLEGGLCREKRLFPADFKRLQGAWLVTALSLTPVTAIQGASFHEKPLPLQPAWMEKLRAFLET